MQRSNIFCFLLPLLGFSYGMNKAQDAKEIFICYGKIDPIIVQGFKLVVLEQQHYSENDISIFKRNNDKVLGYISLTEVNETSFYYEKMAPYISGRNEHWNSYFLNISNSNAKQILLEVTQKILDKGFDGLLLDNIDNTSQWGTLSSAKSDIVHLVKKIKIKHENIFLLQNSGMFLAHELNNYTDAILIESVITKYDFESKKYTLRDTLTKTNILKELNFLKKKIKKPILIVEYVNELGMKQQVESELNNLGYSYFMANIDLMSQPIFLKKY